MSYYGAKGDFYTGRTGYYRMSGDPGFFSNIIGDVRNFAGTAIKAYGGYLTGGIGGAIKAVAAHPTISAAGAAGVGGLAAGAVVARGRRTLSPGVMTLPGTAVTAGIRRGAGSQRMRVARGGGVRYRRMNVCNPRALRRAIRRTHGFAKLAMRTIHIVHPKKRATFGGFRRKRRK